MGLISLAIYTIMRKHISCQAMILLLFLVVSGCRVVCDPAPMGEETPIWNDIDLKAFTVTATYNDINWVNVQPTEASDYWELWERGYDQPLAKVGDKCSKSTDVAACITAFDALRSNVGPLDPLCNSYLCRPIYVVSNQGDNNRLWDSLEKLKDFLGTINSKEEAILLARGHQFHAAPSVDIFSVGFRETDGEYELIALKMIGFGDPDKINRYLIRVRSSGELIVLREQIYQSFNKHCP